MPAATLESVITANTSGFVAGINRAQSSLRQFGNTATAESRGIAASLGNSFQPLNDMGRLLRGAGALAGVTALSRSVSRLGSEFKEATKNVSEFGDAGDAIGKSLVKSLPIIRGFFEGISDIQDVLLGVDEANLFADQLTTKLKAIQANKAATAAAQLKAGMETDAEWKKIAKQLVDRRNERIKLAEEVQAARMKAIDEEQELRRHAEDVDASLAQNIFEAGLSDIEKLAARLAEAKDLVDRGILDQSEFDKFRKKIVDEPLADLQARRDRISEGTVPSGGISADLTSPQSMARLFTGNREELGVSKSQLEEQKKTNTQIRQLIDLARENGSDLGVIP